MQDCNNGGLCVAPDACKCARWDNAFRDGREAGGRPLYLKPNGDPQRTGWTGYDCSVPICVQVGEANQLCQIHPYVLSVRCSVVFGGISVRVGSVANNAYPAIGEFCLDEKIPQHPQQKATQASSQPRRTLRIAAHV